MNNGKISPINKPSWIKEFEREVGKVEINGSLRSVVLLLIDCSGSMSGDKIEQARKGAIDFASTAIEKGYLVGLISFDTNATLLSNPVQDLLALESTLQELYASGTTNMTDAVRIARDILKKYMGRKAICIVTDGAPNEPKSVINETHLARMEGIDIMAIGTDDANWDFLKKIVSRTELAVMVESRELSRGMENMAKMLPGGKN